MLYAGGQKIYNINDEGAVELTLYSNKTVEIFDEFFSLMNNEACFLRFTEGNINYSGPDIFSSGRAMMASGGFGRQSLVRTKKALMFFTQAPKCRKIQIFNCYLSIVLFGQMKFGARLHVCVAVRLLIFVFVFFFILVVLVLFGMHHKLDFGRASAVDL